MEVVLGKTSGFCNGVVRAVEETKKILEESNNIYCLGDLVHNEQIISEIKSQGLKIIDNIEEAPDFSTVIIRAHGVQKNIYVKAKERHITLVDLTCPKVLKIHKEVEKYAKEGYYIFFIAEKKHPETVGTISFCGKDSYIIQDLEDINSGIKNLKNSKKQKLLVIAQTTFSFSKFDEIVNQISFKVPENVSIKINKTICNATNVRQSETYKLSKQVDCMIIIGGKKSSNTRKLYEISRKNCRKTFFIQNKEDLNVQEINMYEKVGVMAGASTPRESIEEVINKIKGDKVCI